MSARKLTPADRLEIAAGAWAMAAAFRVLYGKQPPRSVRKCKGDFRRLAAKLLREAHQSGSRSSKGTPRKKNAKRGRND